MKALTVLQTFFSRFLVLALNFGLIIFTVNLWGSSGKGVISIVVADLAIIGFLSNIIVGSSTTFFAKKYSTEQILMYAYGWSVLSGITGSLLLFAVAPPPVSIIYLMLLSVLFSLFTANINLFVGRQDIRKFNFYTVLQQAVHIGFILIFIYIFKIKNLEIYFTAQILCYALLFIISSFQLLRGISVSNFSTSKTLRKSMFSYGWKNQLSAFLQFLNQRLSYYFLEFFSGIASVGIFSVGIAFSEAIWMVSRSLCIVLYSDVVNSDSRENSLQKTKISLKISFLVTLFFQVIILAVPGWIFTSVFGKDFGETRRIILLLSPGILAIAASNIVGHFFAGIGELRILNVKSLVGLIFTVALSLIAIPRWGISGAAIATSVSYCASSAVLFYKFYKITPFRISDFFISKKEFSRYLSRLK